MKIESYCLLLALVLIPLVGCWPLGSVPPREPVQPSASTSTVTMAPSPRTGTTNPVVPRQTDDMPKDPPLRFPTNPGLQALIERAKADLAQRLSIPAFQIKAIETKEVFWPDASLGCPQPGIIYAQTPILGYLIILVHAGNEFEYHVDIHGNTLYCENPTPPILGTPADINPFPTAPP